MHWHLNPFARTLSFHLDRIIEQFCRSGIIMILGSHSSKTRLAAVHSILNNHL